GRPAAGWQVGRTDPAELPVVACELPTLGLRARHEDPKWATRVLDCREAPRSGQLEGSAAVELLLELVEQGEPAAGPRDLGLRARDHALVGVALERDRALVLRRGHRRQPPVEH